MNPLDQSEREEKRRLAIVCRRLPVCCVADFQSASFGYFPMGSGLSRALPTGSRRYSRLETCGTPCATDRRVCRLPAAKGASAMTCFYVANLPLVEKIEYGINDALVVTTWVCPGLMDSLLGVVSGGSRSAGPPGR